MAISSIFGLKKLQNKKSENYYREEIITINLELNFSPKALFRSYYNTELSKYIIVVSALDLTGISAWIELFVQKFCFLNEINFTNSIFYEFENFYFIDKPVCFKRFTCSVSLEKEKFLNSGTASWHEAYTREEFEKIIGHEYKSPYYLNIKQPDQIKIIEDDRLTFMSHVFYTIRRLDGVYDIKRDTSRKKRSLETPLLVPDTFYYTKEFYNKLKKIKIKSIAGCLCAVDNAKFDLPLDLDKYPEDFYKISNKFADLYNDFEFNGFKFGDDFIISRSQIIELMPSNWITHRRMSVLRNLIDEKEINYFKEIGAYILCNGPDLKLIDPSIIYDTQDKDLSPRSFI